MIASLPWELHCQPLALVRLDCRRPHHLALLPVREAIAIVVQHARPRKEQQSSHRVPAGQVSSATTLRIGVR
jgi:hypothetical protein